MSWALNEDGSRRRGQPVTGQDLEERINMYISAMDKASSVNDESMSAQLQRDIQHLVDLMEKISLGQPVMDIEVPPPLVMTPIHDAVANPLGELSSRLSDYHKALYFAEEELSENRLEKIQALQKGLQTIHNLQKRAQAGFPITEDEIPAPVTIPDDSEFDNDALNTVTNRLEEYMNALSFCEKSTSEDRRRIPKLQSAIRKLNFLLTRAQVKRPVWRKDIPQEFDYYCQQSPELKTKSENIAKLTLQARALQHRVSKCTDLKLQETKEKIQEGLEQLISKWTESKVVSAHDSANLATFTTMLDGIEKSEDVQTKFQKLTGSEQMKTTEVGEDMKTDLELIDLRIKEYKNAALKAKRDGDVTLAIKDLKVVKGLWPMRDALEKGEKVDMTLVPPPPQDMTLAGELPPSFTSVADSTAKTTVEAAPQSAHAQVSPFNIRPATETAEDKLARKLTSFLEDEGEMKSFTSASSSSPSSFESDLSPVLRQEACNVKTKTLEEVEKESMLDTEGCIPLAPNVDTPIACDSSGLSKPDSPNSKDNAFTCKVSQPGQILEENISNPSTDVNEDTNRSSTSLLSETGLDAKDKNGDGSALVVETEESVKSSQDEEERTESRNEIVHKGKESEITTCFKDTPNSNVEGTKDSPASPTKVSSSKNPLDKIGFLACQDVPLSEKEKQTTYSIVSQNADTGDNSTINGASNEKDVTNNFASECKEQSQSEKDASPSLASELVLPKDADEINTIVCTVPLIMSKGNDTMLNTSSSACSLTINSDGKEIVNQNKFLSSESSTTTSMPYSVNNQIVNTQNDISHEQSIKNELPYMSNDQKNDDHGISVAAKSNIANIYSLSGGSINFDDASDMQEFQELMDSMSIVSDTATRGDEGIQTLDKMASLKTADTEPNPASTSKTADNEPNPASNSSTIPESTLLSSNNGYQNVNHTIMNLNSATSDPSVGSASQISTDTHLNSPRTTNLNMLTGIETSLNQVAYQHESYKNNACSMLHAASSQQSLQLTGLETLKYDLLLAESKTSYGDNKEVEKLQEKMEKIKHHLKQGGRKDWEEYKSCLENELKALNDGVRDCGERQAWDTYKYLNNKRMLNERELCYLKQHIEDVKE